MLIEMTRAGTQGTSIYHHLLGPFLEPVGFFSGLLAAASFGRMWKHRRAYLRSDGQRLYRAEKSWRLSEIRSVEVKVNWLGVRSLRICTVAETDTELAKAYLIRESLERIREAVKSQMTRATV